MSKESDTLIDAIMDMNIVKKTDKSYGSRDNTPSKGLQTQNGNCSVHFPRRSLKTSTLLEETLLNLNTPKVGQHTHKTSAFHGAGEEASVFNGQQTPLTSLEQNGSIGKSDRKWKGSELQGKLQFVRQSPTTTTWSPVCFKIPEKFDGIVTSPGSNFFTPRLPGGSMYGDNTVNELRNQSKARLNFLLELQTSQKHKSKSNAKETESKPNFLSYVEKLKKSQTLCASERESNADEGNKKQKASCNINSESTGTGVGDWPTEDVRKEVYESMTRVQNLLTLDDATLIDINTQVRAIFIASDQMI